MSRITRMNLNDALMKINMLNGTANTTQYRQHRGNLIPNEGAYMLTNAFLPGARGSGAGGLALVQMMEQGSIREIFPDLPKTRELHDQMWAYAKGMEAEQKRAAITLTWVNPLRDAENVPQPLAEEVAHA